MSKKIHKFNANAHGNHREYRTDKNMDKKYRTKIYQIITNGRIRILIHNCINKIERTSKLSCFTFIGFFFFFINK